MTRFRWQLVALMAHLMFACAPGYADQVWFAPKDDCTAVIVEAIDGAQSTIDYQLYNATSEPIRDALCRAAKRGVAVRMLLDFRANAGNPNSIGAACKRAGCQVRTDAKHPIAHNKVRIIDGALVLCGSFNDSKQANRNAENLFREDDTPEVIAEYQANFDEHWSHGVGWTTQRKRN